MVRILGPWEQLGTMIFEPRYGVICELSEPHPESMCVEHQRPKLGSDGWDEAMVHGRLITAAPKLLAALKDEVRAMRYDGREPAEATLIVIAEAEGDE